ncbi:MAG: TIR domain-containing protein [Thiotrichaceae bacterium]
MTDLQHQIYVSYADADKDWVTDLVENLKVYLRKQLDEINDNFIQARYRMRGNDRITDSEIHLKKTRYLLVILSPAYLRSEWKKEIDLFNDIEHVIVVEHDKIQRPDVLL